MHHLSCHTATAPGRISSTSTPPGVRIQPREEVLSQAREEVRPETGRVKEVKLLDVNMNSSSNNSFYCPEPGCQFKTEYHGNMSRHRKRKHGSTPHEGEQYEELGEQVFSSPLVKRERQDGGEVDAAKENAAENSKKARTGRFYCFNCLISYNNLEELNRHILILIIMIRDCYD